MSRSIRVPLAAVFLAIAAAMPAPPAVRTIPRFPLQPNPIALTGPARPQRYLEASGRRAAFLGREDGSFEAWIYPLKVLHGFQLSFGTPAYAEPIPGADLASSVDIRPEATIVRYAYDRKCDVVILGHRGKSRVEDWLLGSVPKRVSSYASCHVIIVK